MKLAGFLISIRGFHENIAVYKTSQNSVPSALSAESSQINDVTKSRIEKID